MNDSTFKNLERQMWELYNAQEYQQTYKLLEREQSHFPEHQTRLTYWRLCLAALLGEQAEALHILKAALDRGSWFSPTILKDDPDLASLQTLPEFQQLVEVCQRHFALAQAESKPDLLIAQPENQVGALPLLIALHGNQGNARDTMSEWESVTSQGWLLAVPQSSQLAGQNAYVWNERETGAREICEHLEKLCSEYTIDRERIVLGGFSMGGGQAIWMVLQQQVKARGFITLGAYLRTDELEALASLLETQALAGIRGSILVGDQDTDCLDVSRNVAEMLTAHTLPCQLKLLPGLDHSYPEDFSRLISKGLNFVS